MDILIDENAFEYVVCQAVSISSRPQCVNRMSMQHRPSTLPSTLQWHYCLLNRLFRAENIKVPRHWPMGGEFTGDRWIPRTKGQQRGKGFHLMTSSWTNKKPELKAFYSNQGLVYEHVFIHDLTLHRTNVTTCLIIRWESCWINKG